MRVVALVIAVASVGGAIAARAAARAEATEATSDEAYAPSTAAAPFLSLGYRELVADLLFVRLRGYFGGRESNAPDMAALVEAIVELDPGFYPIYEYGAMAMTLAERGVDQSIYSRAVAVLERGIQHHPTSWRIPMLAAMMYSQDLQTEDPAQRRIWDERAPLLIEAAVRNPDAPQTVALTAASLRSKLGQQQRAAGYLRELYLTTTDKAAQDRIVARLAAIEEANADAITAELSEDRRRFEDAWKRERPAVPASTYLLIGPPLTPGFSLVELATGGRDLVGSDETSPLEPLVE